MLGFLLTAVHVIVALILILTVLLQTGKRADLAGAFGGGGSQTVFGTRGAATFLSKLTTTAAIVFMLTSLGLSLVTASKARPAGSTLPAGDPATQSAPAPTPTAPEPGTVPVLPPEDAGTPEDEGEVEGSVPDEAQPE
jgi:preprotein translocase subunit SecG